MQPSNGFMESAPSLITTRVVPPNPVASFFYGYIEYIIFAFGLFMVLFATRRFVIPWVMMKLNKEPPAIINTGEDAVGNGREED